MKREPKSINPCLKAKDYIKEIDGTVITTGTITTIRDIPTKYDKKNKQGESEEKTVLTFNENTENKEQILKDVFVNNFSLTCLCESFGNDDKNWIGKQIKITKETDKTFNNIMLVIRENTEEV